jgi:hypothetical protein
LTTPSSVKKWMRKSLTSSKGCAMNCSFLVKGLVLGS